MSKAIAHPISADKPHAQPGEQVLPPVDILEIIKMINEIAKSGRIPKDKVRKVADTYLPYAKIFARDKAEQLIRKGMDTLNPEYQPDDEFPGMVVGIAEKIGSSVKAYMKKEISEEQLISDLGDSDIKDVTLQVLTILGIHEKLGLPNMEEILKIAPSTVAFAASMAAYKELRKALDDLELAKEQRIQIEKSCQESVSMIRQYRGEMERIVSDYLTVRQETFESGFEAMDQALLDSDIDGYIRGNTEIQAILGYKAQFANQDDFNALMESDEAFRL